MNKHISHTPNSNSGFTLIEVLVAIVVLSIGLLGLAGLQVAGMKNNHNAYQRTQAANLAYDIADRMRANMAGVTAGNYNNQAAFEKVNCLTTTGCNTSDMADHDLFEWNTEIAARLPSGSGVVCIDSTPNDGSAGSPACDNSGSMYAIKIWWQERTNQGAAQAAQLFTVSFQP